jgi:cytochrome c peroxidase
MFGWLRHAARVAGSTIAVLCACSDGAEPSSPKTTQTTQTTPSVQTTQPSAAAGASGMQASAAAAGAAGSTRAGAAAVGTPADPDDAGSAVAEVIMDRSQFQPYPQVKFPAENPFSPEKALLGKLLFWDEQLSSDGTTACGTCHRPAAGGSDPRPAAAGYLGNPGPDGVRGTADDPRGSPGIASCMETADGTLTKLDDPFFGMQPQVGRRRAMTVIDAMFWDLMFWDGRVGNVLFDPASGEMLIPSGAALEAQALVPIMNAAEMGCHGRDWSLVATKVAAAKPLALASELPADLLAAQASAPTYQDLFAKAFGDNTVTASRIVMAIATYERTLTGDQTPWDRWMAGDDAAMNDQQKRGFTLFVRKGLCSCCHTIPLFGLPQLVDDAFHLRSWDGGGAEMGMNQPGDYTNSTFRTVSVRNSGLREPSGLLHDGKAPGTSLEDLVAEYNKKPVRNVHFCRTELKLTQAEQADLVEFMRSALTDPRAASEQAPFDRPKLASERPAASSLPATP